MRITVSNSHWSPMSSTDWVAQLGDDEDAISSYGRTPAAALEELRHAVIDDDAAVAEIDAKLRELAA